MSDKHPDWEDFPRSISFPEATSEDLANTLKYVDQMNAVSVEFLLQWTVEGDKGDWAIDYDLAYWKRKFPDAHLQVHHLSGSKNERLGRTI
jgi:hypothetical protein